MVVMLNEQTERYRIFAAGMPGKPGGDPPGGDAAPEEEESEDEGEGEPTRR